MGVTEQATVLGCSGEIDLVYSVITLGTVNLSTVGCNLPYGRSSSPRFPRGRPRLSADGRGISSFWHGVDTGLKHAYDSSFTSLEARNVYPATEGLRSTE